MHQLYSILFLFLPFVLLAQGKAPTFTANSDAKEALMDNYFEVDFTLENGQGTAFKPPPFKHFKIVRGPSTSSSTTIINGKVSQKISYTYMLEPKKAGRFTIGSATIKVNGKRLKSNFLIIDVLNAPKNKQKGGKNLDEAVNIKIEASTSNAKIGQQILVDYKLYTTVNIESYDIESETDYDGFYVEEIRRYDSRVKREVIGGVQYTTKILKRLALFPQQAGKLTIEPMQLRIAILKDGAKPSRSFFSSRNVERYRMNSDSKEINVTPLPPNPPVSFSGAVGKYELGSSINRKLMTTDDDLVVRLSIIGDGDLKRIQPPNMNFPVDSFEIYDPRIIEENSTEKQGLREARKLIEYTVVPKYAGNYQIQPQFTYFDTDTLAYVTLKGQRYQIQVKQGSNKKRNATIAETDAPKEDIRFIKQAISLKRERTSFFGSSLFFVLFSLPFLLLGGVVVLNREKIKQSQLDAAVVKSKKAKKVAQKRLKTAEKYKKENKSRAFYDEVSRACLGYICDKLQIPLAELTKDNVKEKMQTMAIGETSIEKFMKVIQTCEMALFAGMDNSAAMQETYNNAVSAIAEIEEKQ